MQVQTLEETIRRLQEDNTQMRAQFERDANWGPKTSGAAGPSAHATTRIGGKCSWTSSRERMAAKDEWH